MSQELDDAQELENEVDTAAEEQADDDWERLQDEGGWPSWM